MFEPYLTQWRLTPDGGLLSTHSSRLLPVRCADGRAAMLKVATATEERFGGLLMNWWDGEGAARVYAHDGDALLLERAQGGQDLLDMALAGRDDEATRIICAAVARLHAPRAAPLPKLIPLSNWFGSLEAAAGQYGGVYTQCLATARELLATQREIVALHGDVHHRNVLDFQERGWLAIDPKRLLGERAFDYVHVLCNPDLPTTPDAERFYRQLAIVVQASGLPRRRLLQWTIAFSGLSAAWFLEDGQEPHSDLGVVRHALAALNGGGSP